MATEIPKKIWKKMTHDERQTHTFNCLCGTPIRHGKDWTVLMGSDAMKRVEDYVEKMTTKYSK